jgi:PAS domain S-box-containing protein
MAAKKKKPETKGEGASGNTRSMRDAAEKKLADSPGFSSDMIVQTPDELIHELRVHQIELETQAEELRRAQFALEELWDKYLDLYEFAPIGYLTLTDKALIEEVNLTGATLLGVERNKLKRARFRKFVAPQDFDAWDRYFFSVLQHEKKLTSTLTFTRGDGSVFPARLEGVRTTGSGGAITVRIAISDITDIWQIEALRESEKKYRLLIENANEAIMVAQDGMLKLVNRMTTELTGYPEQELTSKPFAGFIHPDDRAMIVENHTKRLRGDTVSSRYQFRLLTSDGSTKWVEMGAVMIDWEGRPASLNFLTDITKRKQAEEVLKSSESRYRRFFEAVRDGILILDAETGTILDVNPFLIELLGFSHEQFLGKKLWEIGVFKDIAASKDNFKELQEKKYIHFEDLPLETADGQRIYSEFVSFVYEGEGKNVMQCNIRDITERKKAEEVLKSSESRYRRFFEAVRDGILILDAETGTILDVNPFLIELLGYTHEQFLGKKLWEIGVFKDIAASKDNFKELQQKGYIHYEDLPLETADGRWINSEFVSFVYEVEGKNVMQCNIRDITERKSSEQALRESEESYRYLFDNMLEGFAYCRMLYDTDGRPEDWIYLNVNAAFDRIIGTTSIINKRITEAFPGIKEEIPEIFEIYGRVALTGKPETFDLDFKAIGKWLHISVYSSAKEHFVAVFEDITERKKAEEVLKSSESRYRQFFEAVRDGILIIDAETGTILDVNPFLIELLGFTHEQFLGKKLWEIGVFKDIAASKDNFKELQEKKYIHFEDLPLETADGRQIYSEFVSFVYEVEGKNVMQCNIRDITERKQAEDKLHRSEEQYRTFIETANEGILSVDASLRTTFVNQKMAEMLGYSPGEMIGKVITGFMYPEDLADNDLKMKERRNGKAEMYERRFRHRDGSVRWMLVSATPLMDNTGAFAGSFAMYTDITDRKRAEDAIALANRKLALMNDVTYQYVQNKITGLRGYAELSKDTKTEAERLSFIEKEEHILSDIHQLIKNTKEYQEIGVHQPDWVLVEQSIRTAGSLVSPKQGISIETALPGLELYSDPLIEKIFLNLIENAVIHGKPLTRITFSCEETPEGLILICEDDGVGISPDVKARLFDRSIGENVGFGLFFIRECLALSGMTIAETGTPGKGARFEITVPKGMWRFAGKGD